MEKNKQENNFYLISICIVLILIDQITKFYMIEQNVKDVIPNFLNFTYVKNTGGAWGVGQNNTIAFIIINIIILGIIVRFLISHMGQMDFMTKISLILILAGGTSNLTDRIFRGFVVDFIDISPIIKFPVFNFADILVVCGWLILIIFVTKYYISTEKSIDKLK